MEPAAESDATTLVHNFEALGSYMGEKEERKKRKRENRYKSDSVRYGHVRIYTDFEGSYCSVHDGHESHN